MFGLPPTWSNSSRRVRLIYSASALRPSAFDIAPTVEKAPIRLRFHDADLRFGRLLAVEISGKSSVSRARIVTNYASVLNKSIHRIPLEHCDFDNQNDYGMMLVIAVMLA